MVIEFCRLGYCMLEAVVVCCVHIKWRLSELLWGHDDDPLFGLDLVVNLEFESIVNMLNNLMY